MMCAWGTRRSSLLASGRVPTRPSRDRLLPVRTMERVLVCEMILYLDLIYDKELAHYLIRLSMIEFF